MDKNKEFVALWDKLFAMNYVQMVRTFVPIFADELKNLKRATGHSFVRSGDRFWNVYYAEGIEDQTCHFIYEDKDEAEVVQENIKDLDYRGDNRPLLVVEFNCMGYVDPVFYITISGYKRIKLWQGGMLIELSFGSGSQRAELNLPKSKFKVFDTSIAKHFGVAHEFSWDMAKAGILGVQGTYESAGREYAEALWQKGQPIKSKEVYIILKNKSRDFQSRIIKAVQQVTSRYRVI